MYVKRKSLQCFLCIFFYVCLFFNTLFAQVTIKEKVNINPTKNPSLLKGLSDSRIAHESQSDFTLESGLYDFVLERLDSNTTCWPAAFPIAIPIEFAVTVSGAEITMTEKAGSAGAFPVMVGSVSNNSISAGPASKTFGLPGRGNCYLVIETKLSGTLTNNNEFDASLDIKITEQIKGGCSEFYDAPGFPRLDSGSCSATIVGHGTLMPERPATLDWVLSWSDEFDGAALDTSKWTVQDKGMPAMAATRPDEVWVENGYLRLRTQRRDYGGKHFTTGQVHSWGKFSLLHGRIEVRARLPVGNGLWSAHWLMPQDGTWPPEIDIIEAYGDRPNTVYLSNHWLTLLKLMFGVDYVRNVTYAQNSFSGPDFSAGFHVFAIEWTPGEIRWFVDGVERARSRRGAPKKTLYLILGTTVGAGEWGKYPDRSTVFPQYHDIDYVRVYAQQDTVTSVEDERENVPQGFLLYQNYPNPFNPSTTIRFSLPQRAYVTLKVFDVLGREVATLVNGELNAGEHSVSFSVEGLPSGVSSGGGYASGVYFYRLTTPTFSQTKSMMVIQ
jgi:beta-glucanase (GH16 family)